MGGITRLLLLLWAGVTVSTVVDLQKRITGGDVCGKEERLYHVKIIDKHDKFYCGGSLISDQWILTAAHCWKWGMKVVLGVHPDPSKNKTVTIEAPPVMFGYKTNQIHDIMLLKLPKPMTDYQRDNSYLTKIKPVRLPDCEPKQKPKKGDIVQIAGHAAKDEHIAGPGGGSAHGKEKVNAESDTLQCAKIPVDDCPQGFMSDYEHTFCGKDKNNKVDACPGDSGGGVVFNDMIYGVITDGGRYVCVDPVGFMDVCKYKKWIQKATDKTFLEKLLQTFECLTCN